MILEILVLLTSIPAGYLVAYLAKDELRDGRKYFLTLIILSLFLSLVFYMYNKPHYSLTLMFIAIFTSVSLMKSYK